MIEILKMRSANLLAPVCHLRRAIGDSPLWHDTVSCQRGLSPMARPTIEGQDGVLWKAAQVRKRYSRSSAPLERMIFWYS